MMFVFSVLFNSIRGEFSRADVTGITTPSYGTGDLLLFYPQLMYLKLRLLRQCHHSCGDTSL